MNNLEQQQEQLEIAEHEHWVDLNDSLTALEQNPDFQKVILGSYFKDLAVNQVSLLANDYTIANGKRSDIMESLIAISRLQNHFLTIKSLGTVMPEGNDDDGQEE